MEKITLQVKPAKKRDIGHNIIRIDLDIMDKLNIQQGNVIEIIGNKRSTAIAWPSYPRDNGLGIARMESIIWKNAGTRINNKIEIRKITPQYAQKVVLAPVLLQKKSNPEFEDFVKRKMNNYPVTHDDYVSISIGINKEIVFKVISLIPNEVCIINQDTNLNISEKSADLTVSEYKEITRNKNRQEFILSKITFLSSNQLTDLVKFLEKSNYSKEELVTEIDPELIEDRDWIRDPEVKIKHVIEYLLEENGLHWLISKIALDLYNKYEKSISLGQAEAVLMRILDIKLSSTGRTQLYELRKKIRRYENFLANFSDIPKIYDFSFKVVILGLKSEQATKLLLKPPIPGGEGQRNTIGVGFYPKAIEIPDNKVKLQLWDIASENQWRSSIQSYCRGANGAIFAFNKSDRKSFKLVEEFYMELREATKLKFNPIEMGGESVDMPIILMGIGDGKNVSAEKGQSLANELGAYNYIEISETDAQNFESMLASLSLEIITNYKNTLKKSPKRKFRFKITLVGDGHVGKTSLIKKYTQGSFRMDYIKTIGAQFSAYDKVLGGDKIRCLFWDIAGADTFHFLRGPFFKNSRAAIIVYSLERNEVGIESFNHIEAWNNDIKRFAGNIPVILVANKIDLINEKDIDHSIIQEVVARNGFIGYYLTSAKTGEGIFEVFNKITEELYNSFKELSNL